LRAGTAGPQSPQGLAAAGSGRVAESTTVDVELVLAVDVSYSMDPDEQALQREGYAAALTSSEFLEALRTGIHGKIAITYFEWAGVSDQKVLMPWRVIDGAAALRQLPTRSPRRRTGAPIAPRFP